MQNRGNLNNTLRIWLYIPIILSSQASAPGPGHNRSTLQHYKVSSHILFPYQAMSIYYSNLVSQDKTYNGWKYIFWKVSPKEHNNNNIWSMWDVIWSTDFWLCQDLKEWLFSQHSTKSLKSDFNRLTNPNRLNKRYWF